MKQLFIICLAVAGMTACSENNSKEETNSSETTTTTTDTRAQEIADSTRMLDKQLADSSNPMTPDSLK